MLAALALAAVASAAPASGPPRQVFACTMSGKQLSLTADGGVLTYHYGQPGRDDLTIVGRPASGNVHYRLRDQTDKTGRFTSATIRFTNGPYNYFVNYDINERPPYRKVAYIVVAKGHRTLKVDQCFDYTVDLRAYDFGQLPTELPDFNVETF